MKLSLVSWNVREMTIQGHKKIVHGMLQNDKSVIEFLQEVKSTRVDL
jgi:hypothetical protein